MVFSQGSSKKIRKGGLIHPRMGIIIVAGPEETEQLLIWEVEFNKCKRVYERFSIDRCCSLIMGHEICMAYEAVTVEL